MSKDATVRDLGLVLIGSSVGFLGSRVTDSSWATVFSVVVLSVGLALLFGPQALYGHHERREMRGVAGWEAKLARPDQLPHGMGIVLLLDPPPGVGLDGTVWCEVRLPRGLWTAPKGPIGHPGSTVTHGQPNTNYFTVFPERFHGVEAPLPRGRYLVRWTREVAVGLEVLASCGFDVLENGRIKSRARLPFE